MISNTTVIQLETHPGILADVALTKMPELDNRSREVFSGLNTNYSFTLPLPNGNCTIPARFVFPAFAYSLPTWCELTLLTDTQDLLLKIQVEAGVFLVWQTRGGLTFNGDKVSFPETTIQIEVADNNPRTHFIASTLQALLLLDPQAELAAEEPRLRVNVHVPNSLEQVSIFLQRRQIAYRLMVIEKAFHQSIPIPKHISGVERSTIDFVYRAVTARSFTWPFWQEAYPFPANELARKAIFEMNGVDPFTLEFDSFSQDLLGHTLSLGKVKLVIPKAALVNPATVEREIQQLDGHDFEVLIHSLSGAANYEFQDAPRLPESPWDGQIGQLINLETPLDDQYFDAVNQLATASLDEETALAHEQLLDDWSFNLAGVSDETSASESELDAHFPSTS